MRFDLAGDVRRHPLGRFFHRRLDQMRIAERRLHFAMPQKPRDGSHAFTPAKRYRREAVAQFVDAKTIQSGFLANTPPQTF